MRTLRFSTAVALFVSAMAALAVTSAGAQSPTEQFATGCYNACVKEASTLMRRQDVDGGCDRYCTCNLDELRARLPRQQAATLELDLADPASLKAINGARILCVEKVLLPLMRK